MDSRALAALFSSLVSQLLLLLLLLFPSSIPLATADCSESTSSFTISNFLSTSEIAASLSLLARKRKRTNHSAPGPTDDDDETPPKLGRIDSSIPDIPDSYKLCFKMSSSTFEWLAGLLEPLLDIRDPAGSPLNLPAETRLGIGLFRLATGADIPEISRRFNVSEPVSKFCVKQLSRVLCTNFRFWVGFPSPNELQYLSSSFESLSNIPNCCGVISTTRFQLSETETGPQNSIKAQIIVDPTSRILSITAGFRGNKSDFSVLKRSTMYKDVEEGRLLDAPPIYTHNVAVPQYFVGVGEYPLLPWLIVPFNNPVRGSREDDFNLRIGSMRVPLIRAINSLRSWGVLSKPIKEEFRAGVAYIGACSILHNGLLMREDYSALSDEVTDTSGCEPRFGCLDGEGLAESSIEGDGSVIRRVLAETTKK